MSSTINASVDGIVLTASSTAAMNLATGGTNRLSIDTSGNVGIATGNLSFSATGQRITGDMSNATVSNRLAFQTTTANSQTTLHVLPNGSATSSGISFEGDSATTNGTTFQFLNNPGGGGDARINAGIRGTGTYLPMTFYTGGSERMRLDTSGRLGLGSASPGTYSERFVIQSSAGTQSSAMWINPGQGSGQIGIAASGRNFKIYNTYTDGLLANGKGIDIDDNGNVGIGQTSPTYKLQVNNAAASATADAVTIQNSGVVSLGNTAGLRFRYVTAEPAAIRAILTDAGTGAGALGFYTSADGTGANLAERMRITSGGDISVGRAASSSVRFFIQGANTGTDYALVCYNSSEQNLFYARNNGEITTGTAASSPYNNTTGSAANVFVTSNGILQRSTSSLRYKTDIADATHGLADVLKLRSVTYKGKNDGEKTFGGLIAEEVHDAGLTEFVAYDKEGRPDALHYGNMVALAFKAIQELKAENDALKARIEALETK